VINLSLKIFFSFANLNVRYFKDEIGLKLIGEQIRSIRKAQKISQAQLGFECNLAREQINRIEKGKINTSVSNLLAIAKALNIHPKELLDFDVLKKPFYR